MTLVIFVKTNNKFNKIIMDGRTLSPEQKPPIEQMLLDSLKYTNQGFLFNKNNWSVKDLWGALNLSKDIEIINFTDTPSLREKKHVGKS